MQSFEQPTQSFLMAHPNYNEHIWGPALPMNATNSSEINLNERNYKPIRDMPLQPTVQSPPNMGSADGMQANFFDPQILEGQMLNQLHLLSS